MAATDIFQTGVPTEESVRIGMTDQNLSILSVPGIKCGNCMATIERALRERPDVSSARVNMSLRRVSVTLRDDEADIEPVLSMLSEIGYPAEPIEWHQPMLADQERESSKLIKNMAVAGFGAMNIMLLSVAIWSGAQGETRDAFHLISALIALPVTAYAGQPFFRSALTALRAKRLNMDVPIALAVVLAVALSLFEMVHGRGDTFFDAAVTLLFFLLAGRYLDQRMRERARSAATNLSRIAPDGALVKQPDGKFEYLQLPAIEIGMVLHIGVGQRVPVDVEITNGDTDVDRSIVTGESMPVYAGKGTALEAGTLNLTGDIEAKVLRKTDQSFLAQMMKMLDASEGGRARYVRIADRAAQIYAPAVHLMALATFVGWMFYTGGDWHTSIFVAISVLIITCPCALGLAVPVVQVVAAGRLLDLGVLMKDGSALERLAEVDQVVFDKTGTVTSGNPKVSGGPKTAKERAVAKALAAQSAHPVSRAIAAYLEHIPAAIKESRDVPGFGVEAIYDGNCVRLGRGDWVGEIASGPETIVGPAFAITEHQAHAFDLSETLRPGAYDAVTDLANVGLAVTLLSGDVNVRTQDIATQIHIGDFHCGMSPAGKVSFLEAREQSGRKVLMVGDGLNDTPALSAAYVSMAPSSATNAGRETADFVFLRDDLRAVPETFQIAKRASRLIVQNFGLAIAYNCIAVPLAVMGLVTPLIAAIAMSASSLIVISNALRLNRHSKHRLAQAMQHSEQVPA